MDKQQIIEMTHKYDFRRGDEVRHIPTGKEGHIDDYKFWSDGRIKVLCGGYHTFLASELGLIKKRPEGLIFREILEEERRLGITPRPDNPL